MRACIYQRRPLDNYGRRYGPKIPLPNSNEPGREERRPDNYQRRPDYSRGPTMQFEKRPWSEQAPTQNFSGFYSEPASHPNFSGYYGGHFPEYQSSHIPRPPTDPDYLKQVSKTIAQELEKTKVSRPVEPKSENPSGLRQ